MLASGTRVGPYEITAPLGAGGMGEVYRARDTRLDRSVAVKVLAASITSDPTLRARFEREARAVAALDHPHICGVYDVGDADDIHYFVMPLLDGVTLAERLQKGAMPLSEALTIATQIADALDRAHRQGIVHRDLKPGNVMLTRSGAKLLDFGLAKLTAPAGPISMSGLSRFATTSPGTGAGVILGTLQYMAPEQVEGREADARSDIWALGALLYEMVTGTRPFVGDTPASIIGSILKDQPAPLSAREPLAPDALDLLVEGCLAKEPNHRWQSAADIRRQLQGIARGSPAQSAAASTRHTWIARAGWALAVALVAGLAFVLWRPGSAASSSAASEPIAFNVYPPPGMVFTGPPASVAVPQFAVSPDGRHLVFGATVPGERRSLWVRTLAEPEPRQLPDTTDADLPFWSPDSRFVAFFSQGLLKMRDVAGLTPAQTIARATVDMRGGAWSRTGTIVYSTAANAGLLSVAAVAGENSPRPFGFGDPEAFDSARWPFFLPGETRFLFQVRVLEPTRKGVYLASLDGAPPRRILDSDFGVQYAGGRLLYLSGSRLLAQPFDVAAGTLTGAAELVADPVAGASTGQPAFSISDSGVLAFSSGFVTPTELVWIDRSGRRLSIVAPAADYVDFRVAADGRQLAVSRTAEESHAPDIWIRDLERGKESRLTSNPLTETSPLWSPAGDQIVFRANNLSSYVELFRSRPSPGATPEVVWGREQQIGAYGRLRSNVVSTDWTRDGRFIIFHVIGEAGGYDLFALPLAGDRQPIPVGIGRYDEIQGQVSPDGRWIAYASNESGRYEVYVQSFPDSSTGPKTPISSSGGTQPRWNRNGRELFYVSGDGTLMTVAIRLERGFVPGNVTPLFKTEIAGMNPYRTDYEPAPDGNRFIIKAPVERKTPPSITVVLNWLALLRH